MAQVELKLIPSLGRKTDVSPDDPLLFKWLSEGVAATHDTGGINFDLEAKKNTCSKSLGKVEWSSAATSEATRCMGLFEIYDGTYRDHIFCDNGKIYYYDSANAAQDISAGVTFANDPNDLYGFAKVGEYVVFADRAEHTPYKWKHGDANVSKLIQSGTEYKFRYLMSFQRRVFGFYSNQTNGDLEIRYSTSWPGTAITSLNFPALNQLYVPNDDSITGCGTMGAEIAYVYCDNSTHQITYSSDFETPFRVYTAVPKQGCASHHSIINLGNRHFLFNRNYGFVEYRGGSQMPYGGIPISEPIEDILQDFSPDSYSTIVGVHIPLTNQLVWTVPRSGGSEPSHILFYNYINNSWTIEDKVARYIDSWRLYSSYTWNNLIAALGGAGSVWTSAGTSSWANYTSSYQRLVMGDDDGNLYYRSGTNDDGGALDSYRVEPIIDFGNKYRKDLLQEIWLDVAEAGDFSIDFYWRGGDTTGEVVASSWTSIGSISANSPSSPSLRGISISSRLHQIKWGTDLADEPYKVNGIRLVVQTQSEN